MGGRLGGSAADWMYGEPAGERARVSRATRSGAAGVAQRQRLRRSAGWEVRDWDDQMTGIQGPTGSSYDLDVSGLLSSRDILHM